MIKKQLGLNNPFTFRKFNEVDWVGIAGVSPDTFDAYTANFVRDFYTGIVRLTEKAVAKMDDTKRGKIVHDILRYSCPKEPNFTNQIKILSKGTWTLPEARRGSSWGGRTSCSG